MHCPPGTESLQLQVAEGLRGTSLSTDWQLEVAPSELLQHVFPPATKGAELTLCLHVQQSAARAAAAKQPSLAKRVGKAVRKGQKRGGDRDPSSSSTSSGNKEFDAAACLKAYGLPDVKHDHIVPHSVLRALAAKARKAARRRRVFVAGGAMQKWRPQWMGDKHKPRPGDVTHAQWTALWWSRALAQLTVQAHAGREALSVQSLLSAFLDANRMAVEDTARVANEYDTSLWDDLAERTLRRDESCHPQAMLMSVDENRRARALKAASAAVAARQQQNTQGGGKGGHKGQPAGRQAPAAKPPQPPAPARKGPKGAGKRW